MIKVWCACQWFAIVVIYLVFGVTGSQPNQLFSSEDVLVWQRSDEKSGNIS